jgi:type IV pilus assembly protein PilQ
MTFLQLVNGFGKKAAVALMIISCLSFASFAQKVGQQSQGKDYSKPGFVGEPINLNVVNADIRDILNYVTEQYGVNFVIDKSVQKVPVTVNITDVPWNIALDAILRSQELGIQATGPILRIADSKILASEGDILKQQRDNQLDSSPLYTEFIRLNYARAAGNITPSGFSTGSASSQSGGAQQQQQQQGAQGGTQAGGQGGEGLLPIIQRRLSRRGAIETDSRSNSLIITDVRENIDAIRQLVAILDQPEPQVEVEARIVVASRDFSRDIGFQLSGLLLGNGIGQGGGVNVNNGPLNATTTTGGAGTTSGGVLQQSANNTLASSLANTIIGLTTGVFGTAKINALLTAGEKQGQAKTIATPRVTTLNNRQATMESGQQIPIVTTQAGSGQGTPVFTTTFVSVPLKLEVTPQITDAGTVLLNISAENSSVSSTVSSGGTPAINTQRMKTEVMVPDGGTTVVGGALIDVEGEDVNRTPGLSKIPVIGNLFKRKAVARSSSEILFFITPRIYRPDYQGNPTAGRVGDGNRTTTILQPVPLGNPPSNSGPRNTEPTQQPVTMQAAPNAQPATSGTIKP